MLSRKEGGGKREWSKVTRLFESCYKSTITYESLPTSHFYEGSPSLRSTTLLKILWCWYRIAGYDHKVAKRRGKTSTFKERVTPELVAPPSISSCYSSRRDSVSSHLEVDGGVGVRAMGSRTKLGFNYVK